jgi:hypothetical protein
MARGLVAALSWEFTSHCDGRKAIRSASTSFWQFSARICTRLPFRDMPFDSFLRLPACPLRYEH